MPFFCFAGGGRVCLFCFSFASFAQTAHGLSEGDSNSKGNRPPAGSERPVRRAPRRAVGGKRRPRRGCLPHAARGTRSPQAVYHHQLIFYTITNFQWYEFKTVARKAIVGNTDESSDCWKAHYTIVFFLLCADLFQFGDAGPRPKEDWPLSTREALSSPATWL